MADTIPTMRVVAQNPAEQGPFIVINTDDFDASVYAKYVEPEDADADPAAGLTKSEISADLMAMNVDFDPKAPKAELLALRAEARAIRDA